MSRHAPKLAPPTIARGMLHYYHPGEQPRPRNHESTSEYVRKQDGSRAGFRALAKAEAKRQRRAAGRAK